MKSKKFGALTRLKYPRQRGGSGNSRRPSPAMVVSIAALCLAMAGGAYAAGGLTKSQEKQVTKIAKKYAGSPGAQGPIGPAGKDGANGTNGINGTNGTDGSNGVSAEAISFSGNQHGCSEGGIEVKSAKPPVFVCNGKKGADGTNGTSAKATPFAGSQHGCPGGGIEVTSAEPVAYICNGKEGSPWTAGGTLPEGASERGTFAFNTVATEPSPSVFSPKYAYAPIGFSIPLASVIQGSEVQFVENLAHRTTACHGSASIPTALPGHLCAYLNKKSAGLTFGGINELREGSISLPGAVTSGADMFFTLTAPGEQFAIGDWVVTAWKTPVITSVSPNHGPAAGETEVTITGENLSGVSEVMFGSTAATANPAITVNEAGTQLTGIKSPAGSGEVDITVKNPAGTSSTGSTDKFTYE